MAIIELDQSCETPVSEFQRGGIKVRYAYSRSKETIENGGRGQDYLVFQAKPHRLMFALCDGVGNSFFGGIGAQILGESLLKWLSCSFLDEKVRADQLESISRDLEQYLNNLAAYGQEIVNNKDLKKFPPIQQDAYKGQINKGGTQSNFTCGVFLGPTSQNPKGLILLFWLGDARVRIFQNSNECTYQMNPIWDRNEGWSSKKGVHGHIHSFCTNFNDIDAVIAHSDGLVPFEHQIKPCIASDTLNKAIKSLQKLEHESDDVSYIEISSSEKIYDATDDLVETVRGHEEKEFSSISAQNIVTPKIESPKYKQVVANESVIPSSQPNMVSSKRLLANPKSKGWSTITVVLVFAFIFTTFLCGFFAGILFESNSSSNNNSNNVPISTSTSTPEPVIQRTPHMTRTVVHRATSTEIPSPTLSSPEPTNDLTVTVIPLESGTPSIDATIP